MSNDTHEPNPELEAEAESLEQSQFDDASDDFAYEDQDEDSTAVLPDNDDVEAFDYDDESDEIVEESADDAEARPAPKRKRGARQKAREEMFGDGSDLTDEFEDDNDPSPGRRSPKHEFSGAATFAPQRLAKILAAAGVDARRKCEEYVTTGRVTVDGEVITDVAFRADPYSQKIELDGEKIKLQRKVYFALNKPRGVVCTNHDPAGRPRVIDLFPQFRERIFAIGRLDEESEGLLLVTNDGELANRMAHPRYRVAKFYMCHVKGVPSAETLASLKRGMYFEEGRFHVEGVRLKKAVGDSAYLEIVLNEGQNREIRRLMARVGHKVMRLKRVGFGPIRLGDQPTGSYRPLSTDELKLLQDLSEQRAHLDNTAGRGRKKKFGDKPAFGSKQAFGSKPKFGSKPPVGKPAYGSSNDDRPPRRKFAVQSSDDVNDFTADGNFEQRASGERRPARPTRSGGNSQRGNGAQSGQRRPPRRDDQSENAQGARPRYSRGGGTSYGQGAAANRPPRRIRDDQANESFQTEVTDNDFGGGRRRFVTEETPESSFTRRPPQGAPRAPRGGRPPAQGARPPRRRFVSEEAGSQQESGGGYSAQRRPARGPRGYGQAGNRELPARGRGQRPGPTPPPRPMTADGKEILQGKVTGYRTTPKEGLARRRRKAVDGMHVNRKQRQQRRRKTEE